MKLLVPKPPFLLILLSLVFQPFWWSSASADPEKNNNQNKVAFDFGKPPKTRIQLTPELFFGARLKLQYELENNFDLDTEKPDDLNTFEPSMSLALSYTPHRYFTTFLNFEPSGHFVNDETDKKKNEGRFGLRQIYFKISQVIERMEVIVGRQRIKDKREWIYDEELDAARLTYALGRLGLDVSVSENHHKDLVNEGGGEDDKAVNYALFLRFAMNPRNEIGFYTLYQEDETSVQEDIQFFGMQLSGEAVDHLDYWLEFAHVRGAIGPLDVEGFGLDLGATYVFDLPLRPAVALGYALGTGDGDPSDGTDHDFRQTGLQDNNAKLNGVVRLKYYGEMFDPELSNLEVFTGGLGVRPTRHTSFELVYHYYWQHKLSSKIRDSEIDEDPDGFHEELGQEIDLVAGYRSRKHLTVSGVLAYFFPGKAFSKNFDNAVFGEIKVQYDF